MRHRIQFVSPGTVQDEYGAISLSNTSPLLTCWAYIEAITGKDAIAAQQFSSVATHHIVIRYFPGINITPQQQIYFMGPGNVPRAFQLCAVLNPDETNKLLHILCVEINSSLEQLLPNEGGLS
jgi:SPP1 family predicted phage head-tail adaptor